MEKPKIALVDDDEDLRAEYKASLEKAGFEVADFDSAVKLGRALSGLEIDVILCDTDMPDGSGDIVCGELYRKGIIKESVLLLGMSDNAKNEDFWKGIVHYAGFFDKSRVRDMGGEVRAHYFNFRDSDCPIWRMRMPKLPGR